MFAVWAARGNLIDRSVCPAQASKPQSVGDVQSPHAESLVFEKTPGQLFCKTPYSPPASVCMPGLLVTRHVHHRPYAGNIACGACSMLLYESWDTVLERAKSC